MEEHIKCNKCGKELDIFDTKEDYSIHKHLGYGISYDGEDIELHLCCDCMERLIDDCLISPIKEQLTREREEERKEWEHIIEVTNRAYHKTSIQ